MKKNLLYDRIWRRESGEASPYTSIRGLYGSKEWVDDLDIVNELGGHTGCVNALSWSRSGRLLASGSDDLHLNIYSYQPESSTEPFALNTTVLTGHRANIFSVKFMPHSNDRTVVTCAGDHQVRIFDIEYSNQANNVESTTAFHASARSQRFNNFFTNTRYLSEANTNTRVYRSHADRVKRIVTESSPYLFLTCSEDGEVRQWDLRQPSSAYPKPKGGQGSFSYRPGVEHDSSNTPPPLISYKKHHLDLNTISCSPTQPHYIALGGAHLHCFLHDRRMLGRDSLAERGDPGGSPGLSGSREDEMMGEATKCVRRFAPHGKRRMKPKDNGHITACKISDANPNEMVVSWSGDHIYSFDLVHSPDAMEAEKTSPDPSKTHGRDDRKRKRRNGASMSSSSSSTTQRPSRHRSSRHRENGDSSAFRVRYGNGEAEDIAFPDTASATTPEILEQARYSVLNEAQRLSMRISKGLVKLRKALFSLEASLREASDDDAQYDLTPYTESFSSVLTHAASYLPQMNEVMRAWRYPINPAPDVVRFQQALRRNRQSAWRFVQASGTLARVLGGEAQEVPEDLDFDMDVFESIALAPSENNSLDRESQFGYDFLKAILLFVEGGREALVAGFRRDSASRRNQARFPLSADADDCAIESVLIPYLQGLSGDEPIMNVDASRFERDANRHLFPTQRAAVMAFGNTVKYPLEDMDTAVDRENGDSDLPGEGNLRALNRAAAMRFWVLKVGRGILMTVGTGVNYEFVNRAFGGLRTIVEDEGETEADGGNERSQEDITVGVEDDPMTQLMAAAAASGASSPMQMENPWADEWGSASSAHENGISRDGSDRNSDAENGDEDEDEFAMSSSDNGNLDDDDDEDTSDFGEGMLHLNGLRRPRREDVHLDVPYSSHTKVYRGHCNIKTVKDVNFFGLNDEYVVSGSDDGNMFIWDRKTCNLVNILEADGEVVNVVQGHPYEPTIAASGIDNTVKIFSVDRHAQENARRGINVLDPENPCNTLGPNVSGIGGLKSRKRIRDSYQIISQNDVDRRGGMNDAYLAREFLAQLAFSARNRQPTAEGGDATFVVNNNNCHMM